MNQHLLILFSFEALPVSFVSQLDQNDHILLDQPAPGTFKVIKNAQNLQLLFSYFQKFGFNTVCYSNKKYSQTIPILNKINVNLNWVCINHDKIANQKLQANQARLRILQDGTRLIQYGQGFSACEGKEELRMAVCSAFQMSLDESTKRIIIYENNTQQLIKLKQNGYQFVFAQIPTGQKLQEHFTELQKISNELQKWEFKNGQQFQQFVKETPNLQDNKFIQKISNFHYFQNTKNIVLSFGLTSSSNPVTYRLPRSMSVCSIVFRYVGDKKIYVGKSEMTNKIGGDIYHEQQQDKILASCLYQTLYNFRKPNKMQRQNRDYVCLPMYLSNFTMKHCMIKSYNKNKACFVVRPYVRKLRTIVQILTKDRQYEELMELCKNRKLKNRIIKGLGNIIAISLITNQEFSFKGLTETVAIFNTDTKKTINNLQMQQQWRCCKIDFLKCFASSQSPKLKQKNKIKLCVSPLVSINLSELHPEYIEQIKQTLFQIYSNLPLFQSVFFYHIWNFDKDSQYTTFKQSLKYYYNLFDLPQITDLTKIHNIWEINPKFVNYLIASGYQQNFSYFTQIKHDQSFQIYGFDLDRRNLYQQMLQSTQNFIIFGQSVPIFSLIRWIKSIRNNIQILYITLLHNKKQYYEKQLKIAKSEKKNILFIIDHCQVQQAGKEVDDGKTIADLNWGLRTIFIYRNKLGSCKRLKVLHDQLTAGGSYAVSAKNSQITKSNQQVFKTICKYMPPSDLQEDLSDYYDKLVSIYLINKWITLGRKMGIRDWRILKDKLKTIVKSISAKNNRLVVLLKDKQLNNFKLTYDETQLSNFFSQPTLFQKSNINESEQGIQQSNNNDNLAHLKDVPKAQLILYCLPVYISSQRIWLHHDIFSYLSAFYLYQNIAKGCWSGNLEAQELKNFMKWYPHMSKQAKQQIKTSLMRLIQKFADLKPEQNSYQMMGKNSSLIDCLELMKKLGIQQIFCQLDTMFYLDSPAIHIYSTKQTQQTNALITTKKGTIYGIIRQQLQNKQVWKAKLLRSQIQQKQNINKSKTSIGAFNHKIQQQMYTVITLANTVQNSNKIEIKQNVLQLNEIWVRQQLIIQRKFYLKLNNAVHKSGISELDILKIFRISYRILILLLKEGVLLAVLLSTEKPSLTQKQQLAEIIHFEQFNLFKYNKLYAQNTIQNNQNQEHIQFQFDQNGCIAFNCYKYANQNDEQQTFKMCIGFTGKKNVKNAKTINANQSSHKFYPIAIQQFIIGKNNRNELKIHKIGDKILTAKNKIKLLSVNFSKNANNQMDLDILAIQSNTDILFHWVQNKQVQQGNNQLKIELVHKFYQIQSEPTALLKIQNVIYAASKHTFMKRMLMP